jgi:hypothetical protein
VTTAFVRGPPFPGRSFTVAVQKNQHNRDCEGVATDRSIFPVRAVFETAYLTAIPSALAMAFSTLLSRLTSFRRSDS